MSLDTALREWARNRLTEIGWADLVVGIPAFNCERTVGHVIKTAAEGMSQHFRGKALILIVSDGGSTDYTREVAQKTKFARGVDKIVTIYRGIPGKGTSLRAIFEGALLLEAKCCVVVDSDLRSITPDWIRSLATPVLEQGFDFVSPFYVRHKYDGTITNNIARAMTQCLYGKRLRQPIGGDFGLSPALMKAFTAQDVWETDVAKFGIDIWMTTVAICQGFRVCETFLGSKIHDAKDPAASLGPMFRQVVGTIFQMMKKYEDVWKKTAGSEDVPLIGQVQEVEPEAVGVSVEGLCTRFHEGLKHFGAVWEQVLGPEHYTQLREIAAQGAGTLAFPTDLWVRIVFDFAIAFQSWAGDRFQLVELLIPIYFARVAGFVNETKEMSTAKALALVDAQATRFEELKGELLKQWESP
ncbi:MAG: glycosyltransferase [Planctomycetes bacterium]|nr:glycosyltransferase [Planctomycetota bacterium]